MSSSQIRHLADQIAQAREPTDLQAIYELAIQQYREAHVEKKISDAQMRRIESRCTAEEILRDVEELKAKRLRSKRRFLIGVSPKTATGLLSRVGTATESLMNASKRFSTFSRMMILTTPGRSDNRRKRVVGGESHLHGEPLTLAPFLLTVFLRLINTRPSAK